MGSELARIDEVLSDETLVEAVFVRLSSRFEKSQQRGRRGTPAEVALRMLVLKHLRGWSYAELEWEVGSNLVYRAFCRIADKVPDAKTMVRLGQILDGDALAPVFERIVGIAKERKSREVARCVSTPRLWKPRCAIPVIHDCAKTRPKSCVAISKSCGFWG